MFGRCDLRAFGDVFRMIAGGRIDDLGGRAERIEYRARTATSATDQADLDGHVRFRRCRMHPRQLGERRDSHQSERRLLEELSTRRAIG